MFTNIGQNACTILSFSALFGGQTIPNRVAYLNKSQHYGPSNSSGYYSPPSTCVHPLDSQLSIDKSNLIAWEKHR